MKRTSAAILTIVGLTACTINQGDLIKHSKWKTVHQTLHSKDAKMDTVMVIAPDAPLNYIAGVHFKDRKNLSIVEGRETIDYHYTIEDSVLTYWKGDDQEQEQKFRIVTSTTDSLVLSRSENWAGGTLILTGTVIMIPDTLK